MKTSSMIRLLVRLSFLPCIMAAVSSCKDDETIPNPHPNAIQANADGGRPGLHR